MISDDVSTIQGAFDKTKAAFASGKTLDLKWREDQLNALIKGWNDLQNEFNEALKKDLGLTDYHCFVFSTDGVNTELNHTLANFKKWNEPKACETPGGLQPGKSYLLPEPFGVVLVLGPWNYPMLCSLPYIGSAIAAGNAAVLKPSELAPNCSKVMVTLFEKYMDKDAFAVIEGGPKVATEILKFQWDFIVFTGSPEKGKLVAAAAGSNLIPYILELGGKNPVFVDKDADLDNAALRIVDVKMYNWGQSCDSPDYVLAHKDIKDKLIAKFKEAMIKFYGEDASKSEDKTKIINEFHVNRLKQALEEDHGGKVIYLSGEGKVDVSNRYVPPTIIDGPKLTSKLMTGEIFGPFLPVVEVANVDEAIKFINARPKPLAMHFFGDANGENKEKMMRRTSSGGFCVNDSWGHFGSQEMPFGGVGYSGTGGLHGEFGFRALSHFKPVLERECNNNHPFSLRFPPYGKNRLDELAQAFAAPSQ
jgi:aldehyde dehydrogenase (NAD+)